MNKVKCLECGVILESTHRHDFVSCSCPNKTFTDGGDVYQRLGAVDFNKVVIWDDVSHEFKNTVL